MPSATCSIKFTVSDCFTALHNNCFRSIDWLVAWCFCRAWLLYSYQMIVFFSLRLQCLPEIFIRQKKWPKVTKSGQKWPKVTKSGQKWPKVTKSGQKWSKVAKSDQKWLKVARILGRLKNSSFRLEKSEECIRNAFTSRGIVGKNGSYDV